MRSVFLLSAALAALLPAAANAQQASPDIETVIVTASPFAQNADETPTIVAKVNRQQILEKGGASLADALVDVPGVAATGFAAGASRPIIRGMDATRVRILEDGTSSSDVSDIGPDHGIPIDPLSAQSIEVVRGAATLRYGSQAIGGVVNAINNRVPMSLPTQDFSGELTGSYGSNADTGQTSVLADGKVGNLALHLDGFYRHASDYETPLGIQQNSFFHGDGVSLGGSYFFGSDSHVGLAVGQYYAKYGIPSDDTYINMRQTKVMSRSSFDLDLGALQTLNIDGSYAAYSHDEVEPDGTIDTTFANHEYDIHAETLFGPLGPLRNTAFGVEVQNRKFSAIGEDSSYLFPTLTQSEAGYVFSDLPIGARLHLQASARIEHLYVDGTPRSNVFTKLEYTPVSGAIGALYDLSDSVKLGLTASSTGRAPAMTELFARGGHDGPDTYETGDPTLGIERANSIEGTIRVRLDDRLKIEGSAYSSWFDNYIYGQLTGRTCDDDGACITGPGEELKELFYRQQGAHFWGLEGKATYQIAKYDGGELSANALADFVRATLDDGNNVPRIPPYRLGAGLNWSSDVVDAGFLFLYAGKQDQYGLFDTPTPSYVSLDAQIAIRPFPSNRNIELAVVGHNLTDAEQRDAAALNKDDVLLPGRNVRLVLRIATP